MIKLGIDRIDHYLHMFKGKRVGLITNPTGVNKDLVTTINIMNQKTDLVALFSPEHGVRGELQAGVKLDDFVDAQTGITVYSLYGKNKKPSKEMMEKIDVLAIDIQDVGARYYTFLYTMAYALEACKESGKEIIIFDRPNPVNAVEVEGNILNIEYRSFVGYYPIPQRYGLTVGELATLFNEEYKINANLTIIEMTGYKRSMDYLDTGIDWIMPSPNIPTPETTYQYLATCLFEGTNMSEGRGTSKPFSIIGSPYLKHDFIVNEIRKYHLPGVKFRSLYFTPMFSKHKDILCKGIELIVWDKHVFKPVKTGYILFDLIRRHHKEFDYIKPFTNNGRHFFDYLTGDSYLRENRYPIEAVLRRIEKESETFKQLKRRYQIYD